MKCASCQREIADGSNFCPYCGNAPGASNPEPPPPPPPGSENQPPLTGTVHGGTAGPYGGGPPTASASQRATVSMVLGISSIVLSVLGCCCYAVPSLAGIGLGIAAFVTGKNELEDIASGLAPAAGEGMANAGKITGIIGIVVGVLMFIMVVVALIFGITMGALDSGTY